MRSDQCGYQGCVKRGKPSWADGVHYCDDHHPARTPEPRKGVTPRDIKTLVKIWSDPAARNGWARCNTKTPNHPFFDRAIADGYLYASDARCGFEATKDGWINWTHAGRNAMIVLMTEAEPGTAKGE